MLFTIEPVFPKRTKVRVSLVVISTVKAFKDIGAGFSLFDFQSGGISLAVTFATPCEVLVMFIFMWTITFDIF